MKRPCEVLDLTGVLCPVNSARALLKLAQMPGDSCLEIIVDDGEPVANVPVSLEDEGHQIMAKKKKDGQWILRVRKLH